MKRKLFVLFFILCLAGTEPARAEDDFQYWSRAQIKLLDTQYADLLHLWDLRFFEDASRLGFWYTTQKLQLDPYAHLSFAIAHTYLESETFNPARTRSEFKQQQRLELEMNPRWNFGKRLVIKNRNRVEFRWIEDKGSDNGRFRHLWEAEFPVSRIRFLRSFYLNNEIFIDFNQEALNEDWITPAGITVPVYGKSSLKIFYMIQSKKGNKDWASNQVLGTHFFIEF